MNDFITLTSNSEFFKQNPYKQAGIEEKTTSRAFPFTIKGTKQDVLNMFSFLYEGNNLELELELEAQAELELLELMKFDLSGFT